jgi:putative protease
MSPAGYWPQLHAAIEAGADAVYFGLRHFSARAKVGFSLAELAEAMRTLHRRGVKGYLTFNTLVFEHELEEAARAIAAIAEAGADALIVQDAGIARLAQRIAPRLELHASTQMSVTSAAGVALARQFGASRVTLARELSLAQVRAIRAESDGELEIFVHGALCVAYSGQCFSSEAWGGRSANRGQCAQACRLPYELVVDEEPRPLADARYLLSPGDLCTVEQIPEIVAIGIAALKIEGRYKDADYVALATRAYRKAVDEAWAGRPAILSPAEALELEQVYSRGLGPYFVTGTDHQRVVRGRAPRHRGVFMGRVERVLAACVVVEPGPAGEIAPLKPGDGLVFDAADWRSPEEPEEGGHVYQVAPEAGGRTELRFGNGEIDFSRIRPGDLVWRTHDADLARAARPFTDAAQPLYKQPLKVQVTADEGAPLVCEWALLRHPDVRVTVQSGQVLGRARNRAIGEEFLREQLARLGNTPYELAELRLEVTGSPFAPASMLNRLRRDAVERLQARQSEAPPLTLRDPLVELQSLAGTGDTPSEPRLSRSAERVECPQFPSPSWTHLLVRTPEQLEAALTLAPASIALDYLDLYGLGPSVERVRSAGIPVRVASPRILKPGEERTVDFLLRLGCPILVRSAGLLHTLRDHPHPPLTGDFSLNAANSIAARTLLSLGLSRLAPTHDLNAAQVADLARAVGAENLEAIAWQHLPVFHTEHCIFCRFLSDGHSYLDCGRPCEKHRVALRDASGRPHPVMADVGCRNTVFGAEAQEASAHLDSWRRAGIRHFRLEFAHETAGEVERVTRVWQRALAGEMSAAELAGELKRIAPHGVTEGSLFVPGDYLTLPILQ